MTKSSACYVTCISLIYRCVCLSDIVVLSANRKTGHLTRSTAEKGDDTFSQRDHLSDKDAPKITVPSLHMIKPPIISQCGRRLADFLFQKQSSPKTVKAAWLLIYNILSSPMKQNSQTQGLSCNSRHTGCQEKEQDWVKGVLQSLV